jgi:membrane protease YdiL (CAAX protease family)
MGRKTVDATTRRRATMTTLTAAARQAPRASLGNLIRRHPVAAFLVLTYTLSWGLYLPPFLSRSGIGVLPFALNVLPFNLLTTVCGITLSAFVVTWVTEGRAGVRALRRRYTRWRVGVGWYPLALFALPLLCLLAAGLWLRGGPIAAFAAQWPSLFTAFLPEAVLIAVLVSLWEEGGWTGFLLPRLQPRWGPLRASVLVAAGQALFHAPLVFIVGGVTDERVPPDRYWYYLVLLFGLTPPVRALMTWLWNGTRGSVPIVALFHGAFNATNGDGFIPRFVPGDTLWVYGVYATLALVVMALTKGRLAYRGEPASPTIDASRPAGGSPGQS